MWLAIHHAEAQTAGQPTATTFAVFLTLSHPRAKTVGADPELVKALMDSTVAAFQAHGNQGAVAEIAARLAVATGRPAGPIAQTLLNEERGPRRHRHARPPARNRGAMEPGRSPVHGRTGPAPASPRRNVDAVWRDPRRRAGTPSPMSFQEEDRAQVHGRYTAGLPEVNRYMQQRASPARPPHQALVYLSLAICHELPQCPHCGSAPTLHPRQQRRLRTVPAASAKLRAAGPALGDAAVLAVPDIGHTHVCSMFARMSRYGPVAGGTTRQRVSRFAVQPGTS